MNVNIPYRKIMKAILDGYTLEPYGPHGPIHWARVYENGMKIAEATGADKEIVELFALFHDSRRINDGQDYDHGARGAKLASTLRGNLLLMDDRRFNLLHDACAFHTYGKTEGDITLLTCWDADRLDIGRVGIKPVAPRLGTRAAKEIIEWAYQNSLDDYRPDTILRLWGINQYCQS